MLLREFAYRLLSTAYEKVFKEQMRQEGLAFFVDTSHVAIGTLFGALLTFAFNILAARILGPGNFGNLSLVLALSAILAIPMGLAFSPTIKYASGARDDGERARVVSTSAILTVVFTAASTCVFWSLASPLAQLFGVPAEVYVFALAYAVSIILFTCTMNTLRILLRMRAYALFNAAQSVILLTSFLFFVGYSFRSWEAATYAILASNAAIGFILIVYLRHFFMLRFSRFWSKKILNYSIFALPGAIAISCMGVDRVLINKFLAASDVGIYNAYFLPSLAIALMFWGIVNASFFPMVSRRENKMILFRSINKAAPYVSASFVPLVLFFEVLAFVFYGSQYPFSFAIAFFFALAATAYVMYQSYLWLIASVGPNGAKLTAISAVIALAVLVGLDVVLIPLIGISGAAIALVFAYAIPSLFLFSQSGILSAS